VFSKRAAVFSLSRKRAGERQYVCDPAKLGIKHANLQIVQGDVMNSAAVEQAVKGQDVVMSAIGAPPSSKDQIRKANKVFRRDTRSRDMATDSLPHY
jgi:putative NADH-flavin reductase